MSAHHDDTLRRRAFIILSLSLFLLFLQALIPTEQFIHRGDDAFYYFEVAINYPQLGFWSFDRIHDTNGVQPLWALLLTAVAQLLYWFGVQDKEILARIFVAIAALAHFFSCVILFRLLARMVSTGTAIAATGAFLFPMGIVWTRLWGMENALYALMIMSSIAYFHTRFLNKPDTRRALTLGVLLGLTALSRLNGGLFIACTIVYWLILKRKEPFNERLRLGVLIGVAASLIIAPYLAYNLYSTGHLLPVSGVVKDINTQHVLAKSGVDSVFSLEFWTVFVAEKFRRVGWFVSSRIIDGMWVVGSRLVFHAGRSLEVKTVIAFLAVSAVVPFVLGKPRQWAVIVWDRLKRLSPLAYVLAFGIINAVVSVMLYPSEIGYAMVRWWFVENEIMLTVITATVVVATVSHITSRVIRPQRAAWLVPVILGLFAVYHAQETIRFYWSGEKKQLDWNSSWSLQSYEAARWLNEHVPEDAIVGSWNAGTLGFYSKQRVVNLDGLINNFELASYLREGRTADYIRDQRITYLCDMQGKFDMMNMPGPLEVEEVYNRYSDFMQQYYRIYKVVHPPDADG